MIVLVYNLCLNNYLCKVCLINSANIIFACLSKTCLLEFNLKSDLPTDFLKGRSILTVQR